MFLKMGIKKFCSFRFILNGNLWLLSAKSRDSAIVIVNAEDEHHKQN